MKRPRKNRREEVSEALGVTAKQLENHPLIMPLLALNKIKSERVIQVLRGDAEEESQAVVKVWDRLTPAKRTLVGLDVMALAADITPRRVWELFCGASMVQSRESVAVMITEALPDVFRVTIRGAKKPLGHLDREHLYKISGSLPTPKGATTNINLGGGKSEGELSEPDNVHGELKDADDFYNRASKAMYNKALPAPTVIDAETDEEADEEE